MTKCFKESAELNWKKFRTRVWYRYICAHALPKEIDTRLQYAAGDGSKLRYKWAGGAACTRRSAEKFSDIQDSLEVFDFDVFPLLDLHRIPMGLPKFLKEHIVELREGIAWHFDCDVRCPSRISFTPIPHPYHEREFLQHIAEKLITESIPQIELNDSHSLASRGDLKGFTAILALIRDAERTNNEDNHARHIVNLYRMLPTIIQTTPFRDHYIELASFVRCLQYKLQSSVDRVEVNWCLIEKQIEQGVIIPPWNKLERLDTMHVPQCIMECAHTSL